MFEGDTILVCIQRFFEFRFVTGRKTEIKIKILLLLLKLLKIFVNIRLLVLTLVKVNFHYASRAFDVLE